MNCSEVQELLSTFYDGELTSGQRSRVSDHLEECADCRKELIGFQQLSNIAVALDTPAPPEQIWTQLESRLDQIQDQRPNQQRPVAKPLGHAGRRLFAVPKPLALAATVLIAAGIGWFAYHSWFAHGEHQDFTAAFGHYLDEFHRDPDAAQDILLAKYENHAVAPEQAIKRVGYRPAVADGLPDGYTLESTHIIKRPCCACVKSICKRCDDSVLAIFEHDAEETTEWFGDLPETTVRCSDKRCSLIDLDAHVAATWSRGPRHITMIGLRDVSELNDMVAWLNKTDRPRAARSR